MNPPSLNFTPESSDPDEFEGPPQAGSGVVRANPTHHPRRTPTIICAVPQSWGSSTIAQAVELPAPPMEHRPGLPFRTWMDDGLIGQSGLGYTPFLSSLRPNWSISYFPETFFWHHSYLLQAPVTCRPEGVLMNDQIRGYARKASIFAAGAVLLAAPAMFAQSSSSSATRTIIWSGISLPLPSRGSTASKPSGCRFYGS